MQYTRYCSQNKFAAKQASVWLVLLEINCLLAKTLALWGCFAAHGNNGVASVFWRILCLNWLEPTSEATLDCRPDRIANDDCKYAYAEVWHASHPHIKDSKHPIATYTKHVAISEQQSSLMWGWWLVSVFIIRKATYRTACRWIWLAHISPAQRCPQRLREQSWTHCITSSSGDSKAALLLN